MPITRGFSLMTICLTQCLASLQPVTSQKDSAVRLVYQWNELDFNFPDEGTRRNAINNNFYTPGESIPIDVDVHYKRGGDGKSRVFVSIPRFNGGRPITLGVLDHNGKLAGYPDYSWHDNQGHNCNGLTSVFRVAIDECERMWVIDTGKVGDVQHCPPQLVAFDLNTDRLVYRYKFPSDQYVQSSLFITVVVDVQDGAGTGCHDTFVYIGDVTGHAILVVDVVRNRSWRVEHRLFYPFPNRGSFSIAGDSFDLMDGILGMALSPKRLGTSERMLFFHALASTTENVVSTRVLKNDSFIENSDADPSSIIMFPDERSTQSAAEAMDKNGVLFFGLMSPPQLACWNSASEYSPKNFQILASNPKTLQFASGVKIVNNLKGEQELWFLTSSFQRVMAGTLNSKEINFRILAAKVTDLTAGTSCAGRHSHHPFGPHVNQISPGPVRPTGFSGYGVAARP